MSYYVSTDHDFTDQDESTYVSTDHDYEPDEAQLDDLARRQALYARVANDPQYDPSDFGLPLDEDDEQ